MNGDGAGSVISPLLANVYLHMSSTSGAALARREATGDVSSLRYADDLVVGLSTRPTPDASGRNARSVAGVSLSLHPERPA